MKALLLIWMWWTELQSIQIHEYDRAVIAHHFYDDKPSCVQITFFDQHGKFVDLNYVDETDCLGHYGDRYYWILEHDRFSEEDPPAIYLFRDLTILDERYYSTPQTIHP